MIVIFGLPNGCDSLNNYSLRREGDEFWFTVTYLQGEPHCPTTYATTSTSIPLDHVYSDI